MGKLFVIDGLDGSGKGTQAKLLYEYLKSRGDKVRLVSFPNYKHESSSLVKLYLNKGISTNLLDVNTYAASLFYSLDRYITWVRELQDFYNSGGVIICDRYISSNLLLQHVKFDSWEDKKKFMHWVYDVETKLLGLPVEDKTVLLSVKPEVSAKLLSKRYDSDDGKKDLIESNLDYLHECYRWSIKIAEYCNWEVIDCGVKNGDVDDILPVDVIFEKIKSIFNRGFEDAECSRFKE